MSKFLKIMAKVMPVLMVVVLIGSSVFASNPINPGLPNTGNDKIDSVTNFAGTVWNTAAIVIQILAIAAIVIAGVRYMFASPDSKAGIKEQTVPIVVGALLVFAAVPLAKFIQNVGSQVFGG